MEEFLIANPNKIINFSAEETVLWTASNVSLQANFYIEDINIFGIDASMESSVSSQLDLRLKSWAHNLFDCQAVLGTNGLATDLSFSLLLIPLNKEIKSESSDGRCVIVVLFCFILRLAHLLHFM